MTMQTISQNEYKKAQIRLSIKNRDSVRKEYLACTVVREQPKIGRNALCPCGSGKKYKKCCGK